MILIYTRRLSTLNFLKYHQNLSKSISYSKELIASNFGRKFGWIVKINDRNICELEDSQYSDMFWDSYKIVRIEKDESFYSKTDEFIFVNRKTQEVVTDVLVAGENQNLLERDRGIFRGLYLLPRNRVESFIINGYEFLKDLRLVK